MRPFSSESLRGHKGTRRHKTLLKWIDEAATLRKRFHSEVDGDDPFGYNETATVSLLTGAAFAAGGLALAEYVSTKRRRGKLNENANGRDDLYVSLNDLDWIFEFKQIFRPIPSVLIEAFSNARSCAQQVRTADGSRGTAVLIVKIWDEYTEEIQQKYRKNVAEFLLKNADMIDAAFSISNADGEADVFILFSDFKRS